MFQKIPLTPFTKGGKQVWNFGHYNLRFIWDLSFVICDLIGCSPVQVDEENIRNLKIT